MELMHDILTVEEFEREVLHSNQPVLVEYMADWSGACHIMNPVMHSLTEEYQGGIKFCIIHCDRDDTLAKSHAIIIFPTFQLFHRGQLIDHMTGAMSRRELSERINVFLDKLAKATDT